MEILKTTGIALSSKTYGEADILCNYYTKDFGKRKFIIKGLKKSKKRSRAAVEPGAVADLVYYFREGKDTYIVNEFNVLKFYAAITGNLQKILHLYFMLECVDKTCGYNIADEGIYRLLLSGIDALSRSDSPVQLSAFFILRLLKIHGILSAHRACKLCGKDNYSRFVLDIVDLRPVCDACLALAPSMHRPDSVLLGRNAGEFIHSCSINKYSSLEHGKFQESDIKNLTFNIALFAENYFHTELKSKTFILSDM